MKLWILNLIGWVKANPLFTGLAALALIAVVSYFGGSIRQKAEDWITDRQIEQLGKRANDFEQKANEEVSEADKASGARAEEDERRRTEILPAINRTAHDREQARLRTQKAQTDYENSKRNLGNADTDLRALHLSNCREFADLYAEDCPE